MSTLSFRYEPDSEDEFSGRLWLAVTTEQFSGCGYFWEHREGLLSFAAQLRAYPLSETDLPFYRAGYMVAEGEDHVLRVSIEPVDKVGNLKVRVLVSDLYERDQKLSVSFATTYSEIASFSEALVSLSRDEIEVATLSGR